MKCDTLLKEAVAEELEKSNKMHYLSALEQKQKQSVLKQVHERKVREREKR